MLIIKNPKNAVLVLAGIVLLGLSAYGGYKYRDANDINEGVVIEWNDSPLVESDIVTPTSPNEIEVSEPSTELDTTCAVLPRFIVRRDTVTNTVLVPKPRFEQQTDFTLSVPELQLQRGWLALPVVDGNPAVRVDKNRTVVQAFDPRNGSGITFRYQHSAATWNIGPSLSSSLTFGNADYLGAEIGVYISNGPFELTAGYSANTEINEFGPSVRVRWKPSIISF